MRTAKKDDSAMPSLGFAFQGAGMMKEMAASQITILTPQHRFYWAMPMMMASVSVLSTDAFSVTTIRMSSGLTFRLALVSRSM